MNFMDDRFMTTEERKWWTRLKKTLNAMPDTVEMTVHVTGCVVLHNVGARQRYFDEMGHSDNVPELTSFTANRIYGQESAT